ncbi:unnamed protein product [Rodentolepis nana]|uniref:Secreted protein n=1 Tax=Rodentolepis nana TaxID=102285 RepID=A0A0R3TV78_RODNA|nr:unnamed protein product [Rodentolepis nana]
MRDISCLANLLLHLLLLHSSFIFNFTLAANCDEDLLGENDLPDSAFTATSNSETVEQPIAGISPGVDHSAKTARVCHGGPSPGRFLSLPSLDYLQVFYFEDTCVQLRWPYGGNWQYR